MRLGAAISAAFAVAILVAAPGAQAAHVGFQVEHFNDGGSAASLVYFAEPGEQNDLSVGWDGVSHWIYHENGTVPLTGDNSSCQSVDAHTVDCNAGPGTPDNGGPDFGFVGSSIFMGDGDDRVTAGGFPAEVRPEVSGEAGDDTLTSTAAGFDSPAALSGDEGKDTLVGGPQSEELRGGPGADTIAGNGAGDLIDPGPGTDTAAGGEGDDIFADNDGSRDSLDGGPGVDELSYFERDDAIDVNLAAGSTSFGDTLTGIEDIDGTGHADRLIGDAGPNKIDAGPGKDTLRGGGGADTLLGGKGVDAIAGGSGDDEIDAGDAEFFESAPVPVFVDRVNCGPGNDTIVRPDRPDRLGGSCERVRLHQAALVIQPLALTARRLAGVRVECSTKAGPRGCRGTVTASVRRGKRTVTFGRATVAAGAGQRLAVPIGLLDPPAYLRRPGAHAIVLRVKLKIRKFTTGRAVTTFARR
jgi:Ca2+-binding RTX toxin-like protein